MAWLNTLSQMARNITDVAENLNIEDKTQTLKRKMETLDSRETDIRTQLDDEEKRPGKKRKEEVKDWLNRLQSLRTDVNDILQRVDKSTWPWPLTLGPKLERITGRVQQFYEEGRFPEGLTLDVDTRGYELLVGDLVGQDFKSNLDKILDYLISDEIQSIGVYGMGGVGKTTLLKHIHNRIVNDHVRFESSCWITVSQDCSIRKLQDAIAKQLKLDLENENEEVIRAGTLCEALKIRLTSRKFVIILDDVWDYYPLSKVGIPLKRNECKLILTSRKVDVCHQMCDKLVDVVRLPKQEAWCLFRDNLKNGSLLSPDVEKIAKEVAGECGGLPLGIVVLSGIMRGVNDIHEWRNTLKELKESEFRIERMEDEVFKVLQFSYRRLSDSITQKCFLYIALYPEDEQVTRYALIQDFIDTGLIKNERTRGAEFDKGNAILNKLVKSCLLLEEGKGDHMAFHYLKMHDLVRDMAINITNGYFMVKAGQQLREIPNKREWVEGLEKVSLMFNDIKEIAPNASPQCPNISVLFLQFNPLVSIHDSFFRYMQGLQILNLSDTNIKELPDSFSHLENLTALHLKYCRNLKSMPSLAKMRALRTLDLYMSGIQEMPQGMEMLDSLVHLDLSMTEGLVEMQWPCGILRQFPYLRYLDFKEGPKITKAEELISLKKLEYVDCDFDDADEFNTCIRHLRRRTPHVEEWKIGLRVNGSTYVVVDSKTELVLGCSMEGRGELFPHASDVKDLYLGECEGIMSMSQWGATFSKLKWCAIYKCKGMESLINDLQQCTFFSPKRKRHCTFFPKLVSLTLFDLRDLTAMISNSLQPAIATSSGNFFSSLEYLYIYRCPRIKKLLTPLLLPLLRRLVWIDISECEELEEVIAVEDNDHDDSILDLPMLGRMTLWKLPQLKRVCRAKWTMKCVSLSVLTILECPKLERIPMELRIPQDHDLKDLVPPSLIFVHVSSVPGWSDTKWER